MSQDPALLDLYQDILLSHAKRPRNRGVVERATHRAEGYNSLCGDEVGLSLRMEDGRIAEVKTTGTACAICSSSASILTTHVVGKTEPEVLAYASAVREVLKGGEISPILPGDDPEIGTVTHVHFFPQRVKCAALAWETLAAAFRTGAAQGEG